jgi:hypothetical protein
MLETLLSLVVLATSVLGQDPAPAEALPRFVFKSSQNQAHVFEPVFVTVILENPRNNQSILFGGSAPSFRGATSVESSTDGASFARLDPLIEGEVQTRDIVLGPGRKLVAGDALFMDVELAQAPEIGPARIGPRVLRLTQSLVAGSATASEPTPQVSNTQELTILAPTTDADKAALQLLARDNAFAIYLHLGRGARDQNLEGVNRLKDVVKLHPTSHYAPAIAYAAGVYFFERRGFTVPGKKVIVLPDGTDQETSKLVIDHASSKESAELLNFAAEKAIDKQLVLRARVKLARLYQDMGHRKPAEENLSAADQLDVDGVFESERAALRAQVKDKKPGK